MFLRYLPVLGVWLFYVSALTDEEEWIKFKLAHGKHYSSDEAETYRFGIFRDNLRKIFDNHGRFERKEVAYRLEINKFADLTEDEFRSSLELSLGRNFAISETRAVETDCNTRDDAVPDAYDWREQGGVTAVKDETAYYEGYSWAFAVAAAFETQLYISTKSLMSISAQQLIDCVDLANSNNAYWGGKLDFVYQYFFDHDILTEDYYPYGGAVQECQDQRNQSGIRLALLTNMFKECAIKQPVALDGPVTALIDASKLAHYAGGVVDGSMCGNAEEDLNHPVLIVGYGMEPDVGEYWLIKNSWGADWGEEGYLRMARLKNNTCGIGTSPAYPYIVQGKR